MTLDMITGRRFPSLLVNKSVKIVPWSFYAQTTACRHGDIQFNADTLSTTTNLGYYETTN